MLLDYYSEIGDFSEAVILIGEISLPPNLHRKINVFSSFELMQQQIKFIIMDTYRKQKKVYKFQYHCSEHSICTKCYKKLPFYKSVSDAY